MKKIFQLRPEGKHPDRVLDATKHEIRKYVKRQRRVPLPEGVDFWEPVRCDAVFKGPLYIGRDITVKTSVKDPGHFELYSGANPRPCVVAAVRNVPADTRLEG